MKYRAGYKYQLAEDYRIHVPIQPNHLIDTEFIQLTPEGVLTIYHGYAWDGPSGPAIDTSNFMRGSLVHDALYQLLREEYLPREYRTIADHILWQLCKEDGMCGLRAWWVYQGVRWGAGPAADPEHKKPTLEAGVK